VAKKKPKEQEAPGIGHNSGVTGNRLTAFVERIEKIEAETAANNEDVKDIYQEVKSTGLDPKIVKKIVKLRKTSAEKLREEKELTELYLCAMGEADLVDALS